MSPSSSADKNTNKLTIAKLAEAAGVSIGVISAYLNDKAYNRTRGAGIRIGEKTRQRIWETCRHLNYLPEKPAVFARLYPERALATLYLSDEVGHFVRNRYYSLILDGIFDAATNLDLPIGIARFRMGKNYSEPDDESSIVPPSLVDCTKFILGGEPNESLVAKLVEAGRHIVYVSRYVNLPGVFSIVPDYFEAARTGIHALQDLGHRRIAIVSMYYHRKGSYNLHELTRGCSAAMHENGIPFSEQSVWREDGELVNGRPSTIAEKLLGDPEQRPTAIFCFDDFAAENMILACYECGLRVPEDISVMGCADDRATYGFQPRLSTVHLPLYEIGKEALHQLNHIAMEGLTHQKNIKVMPVHRVMRDTTRAI